MATELTFPVKTLFKFFHFLFTIITSALYPIFALIYENQRGKLPGPETRLTLEQAEILKTPASVLTHKIRKREIKSVDVVQAFITRIKQVNPILNAVVAERFSCALEEAKHVDSVLDSGNVPEEWNEENAPLLGVPFTAKEAMAIKGTVDNDNLFIAGFGFRYLTDDFIIRSFNGMPNSSGLLQRKNLVSNFDADVVSNLRKGGAIPIALTNVSELCMWYESSNLIYGRTKNAYHQGRTVGGSSGGEGCILSAAGSVVGIGSDIGGSIRMPAVFNGIFGHKPTSGVISNSGQFPNAEKEAQTFLSTGPMCRYAVDLIPMFKAMAGPVETAKVKLDQKVDLHKVKFCYMEHDGGSFFLSPVDAQIRKAVYDAISHFEANFHGVIAEKVSLKLLKKSFPIWSVKMSSSGDTPFVTLMGDGKPVNLGKELLKWIIQYPSHTLPAIGLGITEKFPFDKKFVSDMRSECDELRKEIEELLGDNGVFIYPTHPVPAPYHNQPLSLIANFAYTAIFNVLGLPVTAVPMGLCKEGVPIGVQVVSSRLNDHLTIAVAQELENAFGGWVPPY